MRTADELVAELFRIQNEQHPDDDPGDLTIDIQDDARLAAVHQDTGNGMALLAVGPTIQAALETALHRVTTNRGPILGYEPNMNSSSRNPDALICALRHYRAGFRADGIAARIIRFVERTLDNTRRDGGGAKT